jgi:small subunit ribosomal protein S2
MVKDTPTLLELLKAGVHFGHRKGKRHPKMEPYIFAERNDIHIIDLEKTRKALARALEFVRDLSARGGIIVFVGTKRQVGRLVRQHAERAGCPFVGTRWLGGTITNFGIIHKVIDKFLTLKTQEEKGELGKYTKKEQLEIHRDIERMEGMVGGIRTLTRVPDALYIVDPKHERTAVREAKRKGVPVVALCDTNANIEGIRYVIPANDDATKSIELITALVADAVLEGKAAAKEAGEVKVEGATAAQAATIV